MPVCDVCNEWILHPTEYSVTTATLRKATENGFIPSTLRELEKMASTPGARSRVDDLWMRAIEMGAASDWALCHNCHTDVMAFAGNVPSPELPRKRKAKSRAGDRSPVRRAGVPFPSQNSVTRAPQQEQELESDVFISYAAEDGDFANRLAGGLMVRGVNVWFAPISLKLGDSILAGIEEGLRTSRSGLIIVSTAFLDKQWTNYELDILLRQAIEKKKTLLQVWHNVTKEQIDKRYMGLSGLLAVNSSLGLRSIIESVAEACTSFAPLRGTTPVWESPRYRFLSGIGEIQLQKVGGPTVSIFELLANFGKEHFPLALDGELFSRRDLARHAWKAIQDTPGISQRWTDSDRLFDAIREEGVNTEDL